MPVNTGGRGKDVLRAFYRDVFIPSWPDDLETTTVNRVVGEGQLVEELHSTFTHSNHSNQMDWFLPNVPPTHKQIAMDIVVVVQFQGEKKWQSSVFIGITRVSCDRWDCWKSE